MDHSHAARGGDAAGACRLRLASWCSARTSRPLAGGSSSCWNGSSATRRRLEPRVVTMATPGDADFDARQPYAVRRVAWLPRSRRLSFLWLNAVAVSGGPASPTFGRVEWSHRDRARGVGDSSACWRIPTVQYLHADEVRAAPRLAAFALRSRDRCGRCEPAHRRARPSRGRGCRAYPPHSPGRGPRYGGRPSARRPPDASHRRSPGGRVQGSRRGPPRIDFDQGAACPT